MARSALNRGTRRSSLTVKAALPPQGAETGTISTTKARAGLVPSLRHQ